MATITTTAVGNLKETLISTVALDGTDDTFALTGKTGLLILRNDSGAAITPTISGDEATIVTVNGLGELDISAGYTFDAIADGTAVVLKAGVKKDYLTGVISIAGGTGLDAEYLEL